MTKNYSFYKRNIWYSGSFSIWLKKPNYFKINFTFKRPNEDELDEYEIISNGTELLYHSLFGSNRRGDKFLIRQSAHNNIYFTIPENINSISKLYNKKSIPFYDFEGLFNGYLFNNINNLSFINKQIVETNVNELLQNNINFNDIIPIIKDTELEKYKLNIYTNNEYKDTIKVYLNRDNFLIDSIENYWYISIGRDYNRSSEMHTSRYSNYKKLNQSCFLQRWKLSYL
ncbi:MAG: hypothetical protein IPL31_15765 [Saprospiraceae bacterium]|nr:hypothetical protein [Saprospiraceae bacterium]